MWLDVNHYFLTLIFFLVQKLTLFEKEKKKKNEVKLILYKDRRNINILVSHKRLIQDSWSHVVLCILV